MLSATLVTSFAGHALPRLSLRGHKELTVVVRNIGASSRGTVALNVYLSTDATLDAADPVLLMKPAASVRLQRNAVHKFAVRVIPPPATPVGGYFLFAVAQGGGGLSGSSGNVFSTSAARRVLISVASPHRPDGHGASGGDDDAGEFIDAGYDADDETDDPETPSQDNPPTPSTAPSDEGSSNEDTSYDSEGGDF